MRERLEPLLPDTIAALTVALVTPGERVAAARVILERLLPVRAALALAAETDPQGGSRIVLTLVPDSAGDDDGDR